MRRSACRRIVALATLASVVVVVAARVGAGGAAAGAPGTSAAYLIGTVIIGFTGAVPAIVRRRRR